jgi:hypothetical protein
MSRVKGAVLAAVVVFGLLLASGTISAIASTPTGVFALVSIMAVALLLSGWINTRR